MTDPIAEGVKLVPGWPDPTPEMLDDAMFNAIWSVIKTWDINVPHAYSGYCGATGNHARAIYDALVAAGENSMATPSPCNMSVDEWIEQNFNGHGMAMRRKEDPPIPGEPLMSMAIAKDLTRQAVRAFSAAPASPVGEDVVEKVRKILEEIETETNRATRDFHGNGYSAAFAHNRAKAALAALIEALEKAEANALEKAAKIAKNGCLVPPDGGSPTKQETDLCDHIAAAIRNLKE